MALPRALTLPIQIAYSAVVWVLAYAVMFVGAVTAAIGLLVIDRRKVHYYMAWWMRRAIGVTLSRVRVTYDPGFDPLRPSMFCMNHTNVMDAHVACSTIPRVFGGLMNAWQFHIPAYGWIMRMAHGIPVRGRGTDSFREIEAGIRRNVDRGVSVLVFPEAHRTRDGKIRPFERGVFHMAARLGIPVVPVAARGMYVLNRRGSYLLRPGRISVLFGPQIETRGMKGPQTKELAERMKAYITEYVEHGTIPDARPLLELSTRAPEVGGEAPSGERELC